MANKILHVVIGIVRDESERILVALRPAHVYMPGVWEFPGGKVESGEDALAALKREFKEEVGIDIYHATPLLEHQHAYPDRKVLLDVWSIDEYHGEPKGCEGQEIRWLPAADLEQYTFPEGNSPIIQILQA